MAAGDGRAAPCRSEVRDMACGAGCRGVARFRRLWPQFATSPSGLCRTISHRSQQRLALGGGKNVTDKKAPSTFSTASTTCQSSRSATAPTAAPQALDCPRSCLVDDMHRRLWMVVLMRGPSCSSTQEESWEEGQGGIRRILELSFSRRQQVDRQREVLDDSRGTRDWGSGKSRDANSAAIEGEWAFRAVLGTDISKSVQRAITRRCAGLGHLRRGHRSHGSRRSGPSLPGSTEAPVRERYTSWLCMLPPGRAPAKEPPVEVLKSRASPIDNGIGLETLARPSC